MKRIVMTMKFTHIIFLALFLIYFASLFYSEAESHEFMLTVTSDELSPGELVEFEFKGTEIRDSNLTLQVVDPNNATIYVMSMWADSQDEANASIRLPLNSSLGSYIAIFHLDDQQEIQGVVETIRHSDIDLET